MTNFEKEETETVTESTGKTEIEVAKYNADLIQFSEKKHKPEKVSTESKRIPDSDFKKGKSRNDKKKSKASNMHQLPLPTNSQIMQQGSSEREIMDSIALTKTKFEKKEEKHPIKPASRKSKRRKEKREHSRLSR